MRWQDLIATSRLLTSTPDPNTAPLPRIPSEGR